MDGRLELARFRQSLILPLSSVSMTKCAIRLPPDRYTEHVVNPFLACGSRFSTVPDHTSLWVLRGAEDVPD
jgi:hypothetical protein